MKRLFLTALALSLLAAPAAHAGPQAGARHEVHKVQTVKKQVRHKADGGHVVRKKVVTTKRWAKGRHVPGWQRKQVVRDYHRYHLRKPGRGQQWLRIGNDYLLISLNTGTVRLVVGR